MNKVKLFILSVFSPRLIKIRYRYMMSLIAILNLIKSFIWIIFSFDTSFDSTAINESTESPLSFNSTFLASTSPLFNKLNFKSKLVFA